MLGYAFFRLIYFSAFVLHKWISESPNKTKEKLSHEVESEQNDDFNDCNRKQNLIAAPQS